MSDKLNPYRRWLGLSQPQPDFFQLLGIERSELRPEAIRAAAEARLDFLKAFEDQSGKVERKQLAEEIKLAFRILSQPEKRVEYLGKLQGLGERPAPPPLPISVALAKSNPAAASPNAIPLADVPLANPVKNSESATPVDPLAAVAQLGSQQKKNFRRSKSWLVPTLSLVLFLGGPLLVLGIIWLNSNQDRVAKAASSTQENSGKSSAGSPKGKPAAAEKSPFEGLIKLPAASEREQVEPTPNGESSTGNELELAEQTEKPPSETGSGGTVEMQPENNQPDGLGLGTSDYASPPVTEVIRSVWVDLRLRNEESASRRVLSEKGLLVNPAETRQLAAIGEAVELSQAFWKQVISSCRRMKTGEIRFGEDVAMFVESTDQFVVLKLKGVLVKIQLAYLPKSIAIELAERGRIDDIPRWRLQKSVALMVNPREAAKNESAIREWLGLSANDGHETGNLLWLLERQLAENQPRERLDPPAGEAHSLAVKSLSEKVPDKQLAQNNMAGRSLVIQQLQALARQTPDPNVRFAALERARKHAIRKADLVVSRQVIERLGAEFEIDIEESWLEDIESMTDYVQSPQQAELVCEALIASHGYPWPNFQPGVAAEQKLSSAEDLARKYELKMTLDRIHFLTGQK